MDAADVLSFLESLPTVRPVVRTRSRINTDGVAVIVLDNADSPGMETAIATRGDSWYSLQFPGGFMYDWVDEDASDDEVREILERYMRIAHAFLQGRSEITLSRHLRLPILTVHLDDGDVEINQTLNETFALLGHRLRFWRRDATK